MISGVSRDTIYRHRRLIKQRGVAALNRQEPSDQYHKNRTDQEIANTVIEFSVHKPHAAQVLESNQLNTGSPAYWSVLIKKWRVTAPFFSPTF